MKDENKNSSGRVSEMRVIKPPPDFSAGTATSGFVSCLEKELRKNKKTEFCLDLSEVLYMDTFSFRAVFNLLPMITQVIPPKDQHIVEIYNLWLDSKKGLKKQPGPIKEGYE